MYPLIHFSLGSWTIEFLTERALFYVALAVSFILFYRMTKISLWKVVVLETLCVFSALLGSRLLHLLWENRTPFSSLTWNMLTDFQGMVLYGGIILGAITFAVFSTFFASSTASRKKMWDALAVVSCLDIFILRVGCFVQGCCWGKICPFKWAVRYENENSYMPMMGIPVHPVQLYEAFFALILFFYLGRLFVQKNSRQSGRLFYVFLIGYATIRLFTEHFRGDDFRGIDLILGLSTSQIISLVIGVVATTLYLRSTEPIFFDRLQ
jgi:phosphatidylglycerol:prolipoprotein diacylglycerol transferase